MLVGLVTLVELVCVLLIVFYAVANRVIGSLLFFLASIYIFLWALSNSFLYGIVAFFGVFFAAGWLLGASSLDSGTNTGGNDNFKLEDIKKGEISLFFIFIFYHLTLDFT
ncbi:hypothetical protein [Bacillus thuringiensis]|uniref:hypothetical protein n=1 Tax=Bacillus thuringiensis TaxID=1428 RepID=UPI0021D69492|nr:hypothetical protein [Bacillus thuringiensis]MCU7667966.1 hypothetical protein [Bacillus thuringiensis]